jgi:hypothetical protein
MDSVHVPWGWLVALAVVVGAAALLIEAFDDDREAVSIDAVTAESDFEVIEVAVFHHGCGLPRPEVSVDEDERAVEMWAVYDDSGDCDDVIVHSDVSVELERPLGTRVIEVRRVADSGQLTCVIDGQPSDRCLRP